MGDVIGSAEFELRARREQLKKDLADAERDVKVATGKMEDDATKSGERVSGSMGRMSKGIAAGIAALTAVFAAGLAMALQFQQASLKMADTLANSARKIGISTTALQEWQYVARKSGEDANAVSGALDTFANKLSSAAAGLSKEDMKSFATLMLKPEDLRKFKDTEEALDAVIDRIGALKSESDRAAIAEKLGLSPLVNALRDGSDEVARLRDEARALGFVMDEDLIRKGSEAQGKMEDLSQVIGIQLAGAFVDLSDEVLTFTGYIADAIRGLNGFVEKFKDFQRNTNAMYGDEFVQDVAGGNAFQALRSAVGSVFSGRTVNAARSIRSGDSLPEYGTPIDQSAVAAFGVTPRSGRTPPRGLRDTLTLPPGREDRSAERAAEREARRAERIEQEIFRARQRMLQVAEQDILTAQQRYDLAQDQLKMDREARDAEIQSKTDRGEIKSAERRELDAANAIADSLEDRILTDSAFREIEDERLANERLLADLTADLLSLQSGAARTAKERQRIELELLEISQQQRRDALRLQLDRDPSLTPQQRADAMALNGRIDQGERAAVIRNNLSPLDRWRDQGLKTADEIGEAYERVAADGLDALNDGLVDAIMNSRSLGEVFSNVARQIIADLAAIAVRKSITEPLADMLFGGGSGGSSGGGLGSLFKSLLGRIPGFSSGVTNFGGGLAYVHGGEILANLPQGTDVIPAHAVQAMGSRGTQVEVVPSPYFDVRVREQSAPGAAQAGMASYQASEAQRQRAARIAPYSRNR